MNKLLEPTIELTKKNVSESSIARDLDKMTIAKIMPDDSLLLAENLFSRFFSLIHLNGSVAKDDDTQTSFSQDKLQKMYEDSYFDLWLTVRKAEDHQEIGCIRLMSKFDLIAMYEYPVHSEYDFHYVILSTGQILYYDYYSTILFDQKLNVIQMNPCTNTMGFIEIAPNKIIHIDKELQIKILSIHFDDTNNQYSVKIIETSYFLKYDYKRYVSLFFLTSTKKLVHKPYFNSDGVILSYDITPIFDILNKIED